LPEALGCQKLAETSQIVFYCDFYGDRPRELKLVSKDHSENANFESTLLQYLSIDTNLDPP
jgi:hypothetical protein